MKYTTIDKKSERYLINRYFSMPKLFDSLGIEYRINSNMLCPFHQNENTPAAHLYSDEDGYRLWCFSENRMYGAWDIYKEFIPDINTNKLALQLLNALPEERQKEILSDIDNEQELEVLPYKDSLEKFKKREITITELLQKIADSYQNDA